MIVPKKTAGNVCPLLLCHPMEIKWKFNCNLQTPVLEFIYIIADIAWEVRV